MLTVTFGAPTAYGIDNSLGVVIADVNGDGKPDIIAPESGSGSSVDVYLGNGNGTFQAAQNFSCASQTLGASQPYAVAVTDLNNDGKPDIITANFGGTLSVLLGNGDGTFGAATVYPAGSDPDGIAVGDFNGDGLMDVAVANRGSNNVGVYLNTGGGNLATEVDYTVGSGPNSLAVANFNGHLDLFTANTNGDSVSVLLGNGDGTFQNEVDYGPLGGPSDAVAGDFNGDGKLDIATVGFSVGSVDVLLGTGTGTFGSPISSPGLSGQAISLTTADFDGDGHADLAIVGFGTSDAAVLLGNGDGTFQAPTEITTGPPGGDITSGDINGDGKPDLVIGSYGGGAQFDTFINGGGTTTPTPPPATSPIKTIGGLDPSFGTDGLASHNVGFASTDGLAADGSQSVIIGTLGTSPTESFGLTRYNGDGSLDTTFGSLGVVSTSFGGTDDVPTAVRVLSGGQILVAGTATTFTNGIAAGSEFAIAEYNADGSPDSSFGNGTGQMLISFSKTAGALSNDILHAMAVAANGTIYLGGSSNAAGAGNTDLAVASLSSAGVLNAAFAAGGLALLDVDAGDDQINSLAIQSNGAVVAAGSATVAGIAEIALARFLSTGTLDAHFGIKGLVTTKVGGVYDSASSVVIQPKGGAIVIGGLTASGSGSSLSSDFVVQRYTTAGKIDRSFAGTGTVTTSFGQPAAITQLVLQSDGAIIASGKTAASLATPGNSLDVAIARYTPKGALDTSFNGTGKTIIDLSAGVLVTSTVHTGTLSAFENFSIQPLDASSLGDEFNAFASSEQGVVAVTAGGEILDAGNSSSNTVEAELIAAGVDLLTKLLSTLPASVLGGAKGSVSISITENGTTPATGTVTVEIQFATDAAGDGAVTIKSLPVTEKINLKQAQAKPYKFQFNYPANLTSGNYFLVANVVNSASLSDLDTNNNTVASASAVTIAPPMIELVGSALAAASTFTPGKPVTVSFNVIDNGNIPAKGAKISVELFLSPDQTPADGILLTTPLLPISLLPGKPHPYKLKFTLPTTIAAGTYNLLGIVDPTRSLGSEDNTVVTTLVDPALVTVG